jgi:hypothetical protein
MPHAHAHSPSFTARQCLLRFAEKTLLMFWSAIQIALLAYLGLAAIMFFRQSSFVFLPEMDRGYGTDPSAIGLEYTSLKLRTLDGETLDGWHVPAATAREKRGLILFFHGNAGNIGHRLDYLRMFHDLGTGDADHRLPWLWPQQRNPVGRG